MSHLDKLQLCEYIVERQLGADILEPFGRALIRSGSRSFSDLVKQIEEVYPAGKDLNVALKSALSVLIKNNLLRTSYNQFKSQIYYSFDTKECLLRLSMPRLLNQMKDHPLHSLILREVFLAGSLTKNEVVKSIVELKRNQTPKKFTETEVRHGIDELTLQHYLIGVSAHTVAIQEPAEEVKTRKREVKKNMKQAKQSAEKTGQETTDVVDDSTPLKVNLVRFVAEERKTSIVAFATKKLAAEDPLVMKVYRALVSFDADS